MALPLGPRRRLGRLHGDLVAVEQHPRQRLNQLVEAVEVGGLGQVVVHPVGQGLQPDLLRGVPLLRL